MTSTGWSQRTGSWPEGTFPTYYTSTSTGDRVVCKAYLIAGTSTGSSSGTLTGTVTGVLGSNLEGTATYSGISSFGQTINYSGTVVMEPSGRMTFTYADGTISSSYRSASASGTVTYVPGTYFSQTLNGAMVTASASPYNNASVSTLWAGGSSTGAFAGNFAATMTGTETAQWLYYYDQHRLDNLGSHRPGRVEPWSEWNPGRRPEHLSPGFGHALDEFSDPAADSFPVRQWGRQ